MAGSWQRQGVALGALMVALVGVLWWSLSASDAPGPTAALRSAPRRVPPTAGRARSTADITGVERVRLDALAIAHAGPEAGRRDPFRFAAPKPPAAVKIVTPAPESPGSPGGPPLVMGPPQPPPMMLKFIGVLKPTGKTTIAVLTDGKDVFYGREGDTIEGRYRIERIGVESIEMAWADGRGRQVIRLSGS
jgi:hypothetical protein